jgi:hypothetical protein
MVDNQMEIADRFKKFIEYKFRNNRQLAKKYKMSDSFVSQMKNGLCPIPKKVIETLSVDYGLNATWIFYNKGEMYESKKEKIYENNNKEDLIESENSPINGINEIEKDTEEKKNNYKLVTDWRK